IEPTVAEVASGEDTSSGTKNVWWTICSGTVTAETQKVCMAGAVSLSQTAGTNYCRGLYNGVEKFNVSETSADHQAFGKWFGDGIGSSANATVEGKATDLMNQYSSGVIYGVS
ncbi:unnamed protein product, partial [marine sediment metagenome]